MKLAQEALTEIWQEYDAGPEGWRICAGDDKKEQFTVYVFHGDYAWTVKFPKYGLNGLADKVKIEEDELVQGILNDPESFGLRIISPYTFGKLLKEGRGKEAKPVSLKEVNERQPANLMVGPVRVVGNSPIAPISRSQQALENRLSKELDKLTDGMYL